MNRFRIDTDYTSASGIEFNIGNARTVRAGIITPISLQTFRNKSWRNNKYLGVGLNGGYKYTVYCFRIYRYAINLRINK